MYELKNGILHQDGQPKLGLGVSYFASYHPEKWPVAPDDDRMGQMTLDIREIAAFGFNHVRNAAFEKLCWEGETVRFDYPFIDAMVRAISENGMAAVVRLQGYSMNHRGHADNTPMNEQGEPCTSHTFILDCLSNREVMADARQATQVLARHFAQFPDLVGFQIYNEPAYAWGGGYYDYGPRSIAEYRVWLVRHGYMSEDEARDYDPPRQVPGRGEDLTDWIRFRLFNTEKMTEMLVNLNETTRQAAPGKEAMSNLMSCPFAPRQSRMGEDFFPVARGMDYLGYDAYHPFRGERYFYADSVLSGVESAAAVCGKHAWIVEYCCRTHMTIEDLELQTVSALGMGFKGINYYAWRSDVIGPEGGLGGIIRADRSPTPKFAEMKKLIQVLNNLSGKFAAAEKRRDGVAILYSNQATIISDAWDEIPQTQTAMTRIYTDLKRSGISADYVTAADLAANILGSRLLIVPQLNRLSAAEAELVGAFARRQPVFHYESSGYRIHPDYPSDSLNGQPLMPDWCFRPHDTKVWHYRMGEVLELCGIEPALRVTARLDSLGFGYLQGNDGSYILACLSNIHSSLIPVADGRLIVDETRLGVFRTATAYGRDRQQALPVRRTVGQTWVELPEIKAGLFVLLERG